MIPKQTQEQLNQIAAKYARHLYDNVKRLFSTPAYRNTGELDESLKVHWTACTDNEPPVIVLEYADQGYFLGYRKPQWTRLPNIANLEKWAQTKRFTTIPGYNGSSNLPEYKIQQRVAWAIAWDKRKNDTWKPKRWKKAANLGQLLKQLNAETTQAYTHDIEKILADSISTGSVMS